MVSRCKRSRNIECVSWSQRGWPSRPSVSVRFLVCRPPTLQQQCVQRLLLLSQGPAEEVNHAFFFFTRPQHPKLVFDSIRLWNPSPQKTRLMSSSLISGLAVDGDFIPAPKRRRTAWPLQIVKAGQCGRPAAVSSDSDGDTAITPLAGRMAGITKPAAHTRESSCYVAFFRIIRPFPWPTFFPPAST